MLILSSFYLAHLEIGIRSPDRIEESEGSEGFDFETTVREESHKGQESKVGGEGEPTAWTTREDGPDDATDCSDTGFPIEILTSPEHHSFVQ